MKRYKPFKFKESDIKISKNTQEVISKHSKDKKYISNTSNLKISFDDILTLINILNDNLKSCEDKEERLKIKKAIEELKDKKFSENIDFIKTSEFKKWFGNSKITKGGTPLQSNNIYEDINIPLKKGDTFLWGKWKNKSAVFDHIEQDEKGQDIIITDTGKRIPLLKIRLIQERFTESLRLSDLMKHAGTSDFTYSFMKDRQKIKGAGNKSAKLVKIKVNKNKDWVTFVFLSEPTYTFNTKAVQLTTNDKRMKIDNLYTQQIRILNIFSLLKSNPNFKSFKEVTIKEIKEVLKSADVQVSCDDPSFWWQGDAWVLTQFDASIFPCDIEPKYWRKHHFDNNYVCKHLSLILNSIDFYIPIMAGMIYKYLNK